MVTILIQDWCDRSCGRREDKGTENTNESIKISKQIPHLKWSWEARRNNSHVCVTQHPVMTLIGKDIPYNFDQKWFYFLLSNSSANGRRPSLSQWKVAMLGTFRAHQSLPLPEECSSPVFSWTCTSFTIRLGVLNCNSFGFWAKPILLEKYLAISLKSQQGCYPKGWHWSPGKVHEVGVSWWRR